MRTRSGHAGGSTQERGVWGPLEPLFGSLFSTTIHPPYQRSGLSVKPAVPAAAFHATLLPYLFKCPRWSYLLHPVHTQSEV